MLQMSRKFSVEKCWKIGIYIPFSLSLSLQCQIFTLEPQFLGRLVTCRFFNRRFRIRGMKPHKGPRSDFCQMAPLRGLYDTTDGKRTIINQMAQINLIRETTKVDGLLKINKKISKIESERPCLKMMAFQCMSHTVPI